MQQHDTTDAEHFEQVILHAVRQILNAPDPARFLDWARANIPDLLGLDEAYLDEFEIQRLATLLGTVIWNATPQPDNAFQPRPLPPPAPSERCTSISGLLYSVSCGQIAHQSQLAVGNPWTASTTSPAPSAR